MGSPAWLFRKFERGQEGDLLLKLVAKDRRGVVGDFGGSRCPVCEHDWEDWRDHILRLCEGCDERIEWCSAFLRAHNRCAIGVPGLLEATRQRDWMAKKWFHDIIAG